MTILFRKKISDTDDTNFEIILSQILSEDDDDDNAASFQIEVKKKQFVSYISDPRRTFFGSCKTNRAVSTAFKYIFDKNSFQWDEEKMSLFLVCDFYDENTELIFLIENKVEIDSSMLRTALMEIDSLNYQMKVIKDAYDEIVTRSDLSLGWYYWSLDGWTIDDSKIESEVFSKLAEKFRKKQENNMDSDLKYLYDSKKWTHFMTRLQSKITGSSNAIPFSVNNMDLISEALQDYYIVSINGSMYHSSYPQVNGITFRDRIKNDCPFWKVVMTQNTTTGKAREVGYCWFQSHGMYKIRVEQ